MNPFDRDLRLIETRPRVYTADISGHWTHRGIVNGGFLLATAFKAMAASCTREPGTLIVTGNFSGKCNPGPVQIEVESVSSSRNFDRFETKIFQNGKECLRVLGTFSSHGGKTIEFACAEDPEGIAPPENCILLDGRKGTSLFERMDVRIDPSSAGWITGEFIPEAVQKGWIAFRDRRPFDASSVLLASDCFPPAIVAALGITAWIPTVEFSVQVRSIPAAEILGCVFRTRYLTGEMIEEDGVLRAPDGSLVAVSRQTALYRKK